MTSKPSIPLSTFCDRTNEISENLKKQDAKKDKINTINSSFQKCVINSGSPDSELDEDFHQKHNASSTVHKEQSSVLANYSSSPPLRTRSYHNKYSSIPKSHPSTSTQIKNSLITASSLYEEKSFHKLNKHNNNKTNKCEDMIACPICSQSFLKSEIEVSTIFHSRKTTPLLRQV